MKLDLFFDILAYLIVLLGSVVFFVAAFAAHKNNAASRIRIAFGLCSLITFLWSSIGFALLFGCTYLSDSIYYVFGGVKTFVAGMGVGILVLLFSTGEFRTAYSRPEKNTKSEDESSHVA